MKAACYLRVSRSDQDVENQRPDLVRLCEYRGWEPVFFLDEGISGGTTERPAYQEMLREARRGRFKAVVVWKLDRLGRSVLQLIQDLESLNAWGVELVSFQDSIDTTTPMGKAMFQITAVFAEMERSNISERTKAAYRRKKAKAENLGKQVKWGRNRAEVPGEAVELAREGVSANQIHKRLGISRRVAGYAVEAARNGGP